VKIATKNLQRKLIPLDPKRIKNTVLKILKSCSIQKPGEINICFIDDKKIRKLNKKYLKEDYPTDVLSFDISRDKNEIFAEILISTDAAIRNGRLFCTSTAYELYLYIIHGVLHLLGYDDRNARQRRRMRKKEKELLALFGF
jgi:probable rRNA maturation factor